MEDAQAPIVDRLKAAQAAARRVRTEAFVAYRPTVAGIVLNPVTLGSYNALNAFGNAFVSGRSPALADVINFVWLHHPDFGQFHRDEKRRISRRVDCALTPHFPVLNEFLRIVCTFPRFRFLRHLVRPSALDLQGEAVLEITRLIEEARGDFPSGEEAGEPNAFSIHAHILNLFRRELGMTFAETLALPLKQITQHYREIIHHSTHGKALMLTRAEAEIWREHLQQAEPATPTITPTSATAS